MPEIKIKHVVSFSSEDKVHKAENILKAETYRKWKCATPGEKNASVILQFEKASKISSIDIGNESSAFVEVLVGRSSDAVSDYKVLLVASSFMSPIESRNEQHVNRVRMFGSDKLAQNTKDEKWDCVQIVCTQPFNKNITYGLCFIKFHTPQEKNTEQYVEPETKTTTTKLGAFKIKYDEEDDEDSLPSIGSWRERKKNALNTSLVKSAEDAPSYASTVLSSNKSPNISSQNSAKRKYVNSGNDEDKPRTKKDSPSGLVNKQKTDYKDILGPQRRVEESSNQSKNEKFGPKDMFGLNSSKADSSASTNKLPSKKLVALKDLNIGKADKKPSFNEIMKGVVFVISGFVNPLRSEIRDKGIEMGAKYRGDWDKTCTHLICAFVNTPKYLQVQGENGKIVTKDWIVDCHKKRTLLPWRKYMLGRYARDSSESSESEEEIVKQRPQKKRIVANESSESEEEIVKQPPQKKKAVMNGSPKPKEAKVDKAPKPVSKATIQKDVSDDSMDSIKEMRIKSDSETEDEEALKDYIADTDVETNSGGDTEDEIRKVEKKAKQKSSPKSKKSDVKVDLVEEDVESDDDDSSLLQTKPDTSNLPLPELPNLFKSKHFYLYGDFSSSNRNLLKRCIVAYNGVLGDYMSDSTKYVITESKWDKNFDEALAENEDLIFVKPEWIFKCQEKEKMVPYQPYIIVPDS